MDGSYPRRRAATVAPATTVAATSAKAIISQGAVSVVRPESPVRGGAGVPAGAGAEGAVVAAGAGVEVAGASDTLTSVFVPGVSVKVVLVGAPFTDTVAVPPVQFTTTAKVPSAAVVPAGLTSVQSAPFTLIDTVWPAVAGVTVPVTSVSG